MNKNLLLSFLAGGVLVVAVLMFFSPTNTAMQQPITPQQKAQTSSQTTIIKIQQNSSAFSQPSKKQQPHQKKIVDPAIKAATIDHYNTYLIQLIDENPKDKDIQLQKDSESYQYIEGTINGKQFVLRAPKAVLDRSNIKLKITELKTKATKIIDASFLNEAAALPKGSQFQVNIDLKHPNDIQTNIKGPENNPPFPTFNK